MRTIVHLSDLHFGRIHQATLQPLIQALPEIRPDLVAVSGDLTQRARIEQFKEARAFLDRLPSPQIVVPGNHDVPLDNPVLRLSRPFARFKRYISPDLSPVYIDSEIAVLGLNTARRMLGKGGRVSEKQVLRLSEHFGQLGGNQIKIVVTHHPFDLPKDFRHTHLVGRSKMAMENFAQCGVDLFLAGHLHVTHAGVTERYEIAGYSALIIQAGTATSTRARGELNSFNVLRIEGPEISVETRTWHQERQTFVESQTKHFRRSTHGWRAI